MITTIRVILIVIVIRIFAADQCAFDKLQCIQSIDIRIRPVRRPPQPLLDIGLGLNQYLTVAERIHRR